MKQNKLGEVLETLDKYDVLFSSNRQDWATPQSLFDELNAKYNFGLDAAACDENESMEDFYTRAEREVVAFKQKLRDKLDSPKGKAQLKRFCKALTPKVSNFKCTNYFTEKQDALQQSWRGYNAVFVNPPYGRGLSRWVEHAAKEATNVDPIIMLMPARTDTKFFHKFIWNIERDVWRYGVVGKFLAGRVKFDGAAAGAPFPSMVVEFKSNNYSRIE